MKTNLYLHSDKCSMSYKGEQLGLEGKSLENFSCALYEVEFGVDVDEEGIVRIESVDGVKLMTPEIEAEMSNLKDEIVKLRRACAVLYYGSPELQSLAENEYSGCASTQRKHCDELKQALEGQ